MQTTSFSIPAGATVLLTGATGFTGQVLARKLVAQGASVRAIARSSSNVAALKDLPITWIRGDVFDPQTVNEAVRGVSYIMHVAAAYREAKITDETYSLVHVRSTQLLAEEAIKQPDFQRFVHLSTVGVHGHIENPPADEEYPFNPGDIYQRTKAEAELWIRNFSQERGLPLSVVRPAAIYGPGDMRLLKVFKMAKLPIVPLFGSSAGLYHLIHVEDLTNIIINAAVNPRAVGEVFIAGNPQPSRLAEMLKVIADELGRPQVRLVRFPAWPLFLAADLCEALCKPLGIEPPLYRRRVAFFTKDRAFATQKVQEVLGYTRFVDAEDGLRTTARWYREHGLL